MGRKQSNIRSYFDDEAGCDDGDAPDSVLGETDGSMKEFIVQNEDEKSRERNGDSRKEEVAPKSLRLRRTNRDLRALLNSSDDESISSPKENNNDPLERQLKLMKEPKKILIRSKLY